MVRLNIIVEGGVPSTNQSAETADNVESLRQSLHHFFRRILECDDMDIKVFMGWGYRSAARCFINEPGACLYVDSDGPRSATDEWFDKLQDKNTPEKNIIIPDEQKEMVFFMVQEMEAWFLKQPDCLVRWAKCEDYERLHTDEEIAAHSLLHNKNIEEIAKPSEKLKILMRHFFKKNKKAARYGKLKTAPILLDALEVSALLPLDDDLQRFKSRFA